jgi:undecaprenyl-diphosphatase
MDWIQALIFGLVQGLTEFLPISSSGHLEILKYLFGDAGNDFVFTVVVHGATVLSILVVFWPDVLSLIKGVFRFEMNDETDYVLKIIISMIPAAIVGVTLNSYIESLFNGDLVFIGSMLVLTALFLTAGNFVRKGTKPLSYKGAFIIGIAQALAILPGLSRSGTTISTGLLLGHKKEDLTRFSFLMVIVPVLGGTAMEVLSSKNVVGDINLLPLTIAFVTAFLSGIAACKWMVNIVNKGKLYWFAIYCSLLGASLILFS